MSDSTPSASRRGEPAPATHTPGPWMIDDCNVIRADRSNDNECVMIAEYAHTPMGLYGARPVRLEEAKANARLIAAAPDMLRALRVVEQHHAASPHIGLIRAAIAKAEGGAP